MFHREAALAVGGFRDVFCEDLDLWCRLLGRGPATLSPRVGMIYHTHPGQISEDWEAMHGAHLERRLLLRRRGVVVTGAGRASCGRDGLGSPQGPTTRAPYRRAIRRFVHELLEHPLRALGVIDLLRYRAASAPA